MSDLYSLVGQVLKDQAALDFKKENDKLKEDNDKLKEEVAELKRKNGEHEHMGVLGNQAVDLGLAIEEAMSAINSLEAQNSLIPKTIEQTAVVLIYCLMVVLILIINIFFLDLLQSSINYFLWGCVCLGIISIMILEFV